MAFSLNRAQVIGNLTRDPEVRTTPNGKKVATFGVATNSVWKDATGAKKEKAEFHNIVCWTFLADIAEKYLKKGRKVFAEGRMQTRDWEGEDGQKKFRTEIVADNLILLDSRGAPTTSGSDETPDEIPDVGSSFSRPKGVIKKSTAKEPVDEEEPVKMDDLPF